jgi:hypothetical protein
MTREKKHRGILFYVLKKSGKMFVLVFRREEKKKFGGLNREKKVNKKR